MNGSPPRTMHKLQIHQRGAWRHVADFPAEDGPQLRREAAHLFHVLNAKGRILGQLKEGERMPPVLALFTPDTGWMERN
jgi:hypothetical protein